MSAVAVVVIVGFICCALVIRALATADERAPHSWGSNAATDLSRVTGGMSMRAMMDE